MTTRQPDCDADEPETRVLWNRLHAIADKTCETAKRLALSLSIRGRDDGLTPTITRRDTPRSGRALVIGDCVVMMYMTEMFTNESGPDGTSSAHDDCTIGSHP